MFIYDAFLGPTGWFCISSSLKKKHKNLYSNRLDRVQQVAVDQANAQIYKLEKNVVRGVVLLDSEFLFFGWSKTQGMKDNQRYKREGVIQKVAQSKLQHFAEISRNSMKFLCFFCWPLAVPSKQLYIGHVLTCSMWGGGGIKEPRQRQGLINHGKCWSIKLRRVYHVISTGFPWCFNSNIGFVYGFVII